MPILGPRALTTGIAFIAVTESGEVCAVHEDGSGALCRFSERLGEMRGDESRPEGDALHAGIVDVHLMKGAKRFCLV